LFCNPVTQINHKDRVKTVIRKGGTSMKDPAIPLNKSDLRQSDVRSSNVAYLELVELNPVDETPSNNAYSTHGYSIVKDSSGRVLCPDKL
jgi:hypothetical protein